MIYCKELNKEFETKEELFKALKENKEFIISAKKSQIYKNFEKGVSLVNNQEFIKKLNESNKSLSFDDNYYYFVTNSSRILDSHKDVHLDGNWEKTVKEQQGKVYLIFDHQLKRSEIVAMKEDIEILTATIPFSAIGKNYEGDTYVLIYKVRKDKILNKEAKEWLEKGYSFEASVRMQYMDIVFALNSDNPDDIKEKEIFDKIYPLIANKEDFEEILYFWGIKQAKNVLESSLVMFGSNPATGLIQENKTEPSEDTQTQKEAVKLDTSHSSNFFNTI